MSDRVEEFYEKLKKLQEPKGLYFNKDREMVMELLNSLLENMDRYGYTVCPCRLAAGKYELDKDIICPCVYAQADIREYGSCYCGLYVSYTFNQGETEPVCVPERRPPEKTMAAVEII